MRRPSRLLPRLALLLVALLLSACAGGGPDSSDGPRAWRDLDLVVPDDWVVLDERPDLLLVANEDIRVDDLDAPPTLPEDRNSNDVVAVQMLADQTTTPADWRELVRAEGGTVEEDAQLTVGGLPATAITYSWVSNDIPSRERVVFVPSRSLSILLQPVPVEGQTNGPDVYDRHTDEFAALLDSIEFGRPVEE